MNRAERIETDLRELVHAVRMSASAVPAHISDKADRAVKTLLALPPDPQPQPGDAGLLRELRRRLEDRLRTVALVEENARAYADSDLVFTEIDELLAARDAEVVRLTKDLRALRPGCPPESQHVVHSVSFKPIGEMSALASVHYLAPPHPTHRCKVCGALWHHWDHSWSLVSEHCGACCDNVPMGKQIESLLDLVGRLKEAEQGRDLAHERVIRAESALADVAKRVAAWMPASTDSRKPAAPEAPSA